MPEFRPFSGVRYDCEAAGAELGDLAAPPYDVVDEEQRSALEATDPHNAVRLILPRDVAAGGDRYSRAAATFRTWLDAGVLVVDREPRFYAYRMDFTGPRGEPRHTRGVIGALALPDPGDDSVLPHERTLPKAKSDRLALLRAMRVNADPIWGLTLGEGLTAAAEPSLSLCECDDPDGVRHQLGAIDDPAQLARIHSIVASAPLVLADGHHRFETAANFRAECGAGDEGAAAIMTFVVELADDELHIEPIHRVVDLPAGIDVRSRLDGAFTITDAGPVTPEGVDALQEQMGESAGIGLVDSRGLALAIARPDVRVTALAEEHPAVAATDAAVVEALVVPRLPEATWRYWHDAAAVAAFVEKGTASAVILCRPVSVAQTRAAALARVRMPQKTTFFAPKPRTGMVFRAF